MRESKEDEREQENGQEKRLDDLRDRSVSPGWQSNYQACQQKRGCRREQAKAAIRVQQEGLNIKQPERTDKHRANGWNEKYPGARVSERCERSETKRGEIGHQAE